MSVTIDHFGQCDVCNAPATTLVCDVLRHECPGAELVQFTPLPMIRRGCAKHPVQSKEYVTEFPPDQKECS